MLVGKVPSATKLRPPLEEEAAQLPVATFVVLDAAGYQYGTEDILVCVC